MPDTEKPQRTNRVPLVVSSAAGAAVAMLVDYARKPDNSALTALQMSIFGDLKIGGGLIPIAYLAPLVLAVAVGLAWLFNAETRKKAFMVGMGVLATINTTIYAPLRPTAGETQAANGASDYVRPLAMDEFFGVGTAWAQVPRPQGTMQLSLNWASSSNECTITILDLQKHKIVARSRYLNRSEFRFSLSVGRHQILIQSPGAQSAKCEFSVAAEKPVRIVGQMGNPSKLEVMP